MGRPWAEEVNRGVRPQGWRVMLLGINPLRLSTAKRNREPWGVGGGQQHRGGEVGKVKGRQKDRARTRGAAELPGCTHSLQGTSALCTPQLASRDNTHSLLPRL